MQEVAAEHLNNLGVALVAQYKPQLVQYLLNLR